MTHTLEQLRSGELRGIQRLKLCCGLDEFPREIFELADTLEILDLSGNRMTALPDDLPRLNKLRILFCSDNQFTEMPAVLGACATLSMVAFKANRIRVVPAAALPPALRWLILTDNQIDTLPDELGQRGQLQKLMLAGNRLRQLPASLAALSRLELLRISANQLTALPDWLFALPRLAWLACAGNPFSATREAAALDDRDVAAISWHALQLHEKLGEGASGVIYRAEQTDADGGRAVAVKLFKGAVTSDGLPRSEMAACIGAGAHPNLIPVLGKLKDHPGHVHGLLMPLIDARFRNLAGPPSLESCTRDVYAPGLRFELDAALGMAEGIAAAMRHLHNRGMMHGDLYAHNILYDGGSALLGDFGAAALYGTAAQSAAPLAQALQRIEVRAYGCLLEELLERCGQTTASPALAQSLRQLTAACLDDELARRPLFADIAARLAQLRLTHLPHAPA